MTLSDPGMPDPGRRERKRQQTLDHLADTAYRLFETLGFEGVTMEQIAAEADVAKGTLYNHFPVKEALLAHRVHRDLATHAPGLRDTMRGQAGFAARMACLLQASCHWAESNRAYLAHYLRYRLAHTQPGNPQTVPRSGLDQIIEPLIQAGQQAGELRSDLPAAQLAHMFQFLYLAALTRWLSEPAKPLRHELNATLDVFIHGLAAGTRP
ncbi:TetR/AcrR family transcriptional regulator [Bordetella petrii]|uniref:TetR/AcrR family transcriptional regulator n=1 Tax=Bordetella petrii TaxID=94624 RepID=UPI001E481AD8|nr:TetR/AcrR family transcriptional regulator [Bordetella petrii]MCD0503886.1 TetR/AcrR family transcriptional regulator [Bordetella petrii]